jgi:hypothetical protein
MRILESKMKRIEEKNKNRAETIRLSRQTQNVEVATAKVPEEVKVGEPPRPGTQVEGSPKTKPYSFDDIVQIYSQRGDGVDGGSVVPSWAFPVLLALSLAVPALALVSVLCARRNTRLLLPTHKSA